MLAYFSASGMFIVEFLLKKRLTVNARKVLHYVSYEKKTVNQKRTKNFAINCDVVDTTSKQWMWRRQREDDGRSADCNQLFSFCAWPEQKICFRYAVVVAPVVVLKVSNSLSRKNSICHARWPTMSDSLFSKTFLGALSERNVICLKVTQNCNYILIFSWD